MILKLGKRFLCFFDMSLQKNVKSLVFLILKKTKKRILELCLPYGITQCYLPPDTSEHTRPAFTPARQAGTRFTDHLRDGGLSSKPKAQGAKSICPMVATRPPAAS